MSASESTTNGHYSFPFEQSFDLEQYISRYASETRLQRLAFIAQQTADTDSTMHQNANRMLQHDIQQAGNLVRYKQLQHADEHWIQTTTANNEASLQVLEARLSAAQANLNKDAIRTAFLNLADFYGQTGQVREALKYTLRARDYCTSRVQTGLICWNVIELALNLANYNQVRDYVAKAEHAVSSSGDADFPRKLKVAAALALMGEGHYKEAAQKLQLVKVPPQGGSSSFCSPEDVALYSALLGLATMDRTQLSHHLEEQATMLELVPALKEAIRHYIRAEYKQCLQIITSLPLQYDVYLARHADKLIQLIRNRAYVDYLQPYQKVHLPHMALTFGQDPATLQQSLAQLIGNGDILCARINCQTNTLERHVEMAEASRLYKTQKRVQKLQTSVLNDAYASIVRLAVLEHEPVDQHHHRGGNARNPEDVLADVDADSEEEDDDDVDMAYDNIANPDDGI